MAFDYKKDYKAYRDERRAYESKNNKAYVAKIEKSFKQLEKPKLVEKPQLIDYDELFNEINFALAELEVIKKSLLKSKTKITKLLNKNNM